MSVRPRWRLFLAVALIGAPPLLAHEGHHETGEAIRAAYSGPRIAVGEEATPAVAAVVKLLATAPNQSHQPLIPRGTTIDRVAWNEAVLEIDLTLPPNPRAVPPAVWSLSELDLETIGHALHTPFAHDPRFAGSRVRARTSTDAPYAPLSAVLPPRAAPPADVHPADAAGPPPAIFGGDGAAAGGPVANAVRQPTGALTGVTVFVSAGHGWTAGGSSWALQRPVAQSMNEDYGNIDQLNLFVHYAYNAGATVVPLRPAGWQPIEIIKDQDDPGVTFAGAWSDSANPKYYENGVTNSGVAYRFATAAAVESATARYTPAIATSGYYPVFCFAISSTNRVRQTYRVAHLGGLSEVVVDHRLVGNGWVWLGEYYFEAGGANYVEITNQSPDTGVVIADAIRWGDGIGDISRPGPGGVSGYPRDEEAQRYWSHSELGNRGVGFDSGIWDQAGDDLSDNVGAGARLAREMNLEPGGGVLVDRWKRVHLEFHTNAFDTTARGQLCLITDTGSTTNQSLFANTLSNEIDADLNLIQSEFEHPWVDRASATLTSSYGAISTTNNGNEFDATIVELAFHDNASDAQLLRDPRMRSAMARACVQGIIRFLNALPGSQVPLAFPPDTPRDIVVRDVGGGSVQVSWAAPTANGAVGDAATGYVVYQSADGIGFGNPIVLGNVLSTTIPGIAAGETRFFRVSATNAGGESMPSEVLAHRRRSAGAGDVLVVSGFDRLRRQTNETLTFTQPPAYAGQTIERQQWRRSNAFDYLIEYAAALEAGDNGFDSCTNEAVAGSAVNLTNYAIVIWMLGNESVEDETLSATEITRLTNYLDGGGNLFISGSDVAFDLINQGGGFSFAQNYLRIGFGNNDVNTFSATGTAGGILSGVGAFDFNFASGAAYRVRGADQLTALSGARACATYSGGLAGIGGVQYTTTTFNTVTLGFPFEAISSPAVRADVLTRVLNFLRTANGPLPFDFDGDGDVDVADTNVFWFCFAGPGATYPAGNVCRREDGDGDADVDCADFAQLQDVFTGP